MNVYCVICSDHFVSLTDIDISAGICGHTFHAVCLQRWLEMSRTCPTCRQHWTKRDVVSKLYFEASKSDLVEECAPKLLNELSSIRARLAESERKSRQFEEDFQSLRKSNDTLAKAYEETQNNVQTLVESSKAKDKQIKFYQTCEKEWFARDMEHKVLKSTVQKYQYIESLVKATETESRSILKKATSEPGALDRLVSMCAIIKREYEQCKRNKKTQRYELEKVIRERASHRVELDKLKDENAVLREQNKQAERELTESERQLLELKKKYHSLLQGSTSPGSTCLDMLGSKSQEADSNLNESSSRIFETDPEGLLDYSRPASTNDGKINQVAIKITTAATSLKLSKKPSNEGSLELFRVQKPNSLKPIVKPVIQNLRKGYDGLGGHTVFTQSLFRQNVTKASRKRPLGNSDPAVFPYKKMNIV